MCFEAGGVIRIGSGFVLVFDAPLKYAGIAVSCSLCIYSIYMCVEWCHLDSVISVLTVSSVL